MILKKVIKLLSKITVRLLLFNILLIFIPIAFFFYLDIYENKLLTAQENSMVMQGRIISSSLENRENLQLESKNLIDNLNKNVTSRIRIISKDGVLLADSSKQDFILEPIADREYKIEELSVDENILYKLVRFPLDFVRYVLRGPKEGTSSTEYYSDNSYLDGYEVKQSLLGKYGANTRISSGGERSVTLYISLPIYNNSDIVSVVLLSKSTYGILQDLYQIRLEILKIFLVSFFLAILISLILSKTIAGPIKNLRNQAKEIVDKRGRLITHFKKSRRLDEIGDLNISLQELTYKLQNYTEKTESFASDLSHEFKNPLSSIKTATEIIKNNSGSSENSKFLDIIESEISRLNRLITDVREISIIDSQIDPSDGVIIHPITVIKSIVANFELKTKNRGLIFDIINNTDKAILVSPIRFSRVIENIVSNAISFSPDNSTITVEITANKKYINIVIKDQGPGIPTENINKIFNRFFTYRESNKNRNSGLGLSISLAIIKVYGGNIKAFNNIDIGANFQIELPQFKP
ncbi:MAG: HAMP domain-containing histidine kinase [Spirochaetaceae bacterium]